MKYNKLTEEEDRIINHKGTEPAYSGELYKNKKEGTYYCKKCGAPLFAHTDKFESNCGWPSFDGEFDDAVNKQTDADGFRTEITCNYCDAHLGHIFYNEGFTEKNQRYCVNSLSMIFKEEKLNVAVFGSGCFWGTEYFFKRAKGVVFVKPGYSGGRTENPTYEEVCTGTTGHKEVVQVFYNPQETTYENLVKLFFETHNFEQTNGQGPDIGEQYLSWIFYNNEKEKEICEGLIKELSSKGYLVATQLERLSMFCSAELYHRDYYDRKGGIPYCHRYRGIFD